MPTSRPHRPGWPGDQPPTGPNSGSRLAIWAGTVYIGSWDHLLYAFDAATGVQRWTAATGGIIEASAAVADGSVVVGSFDRRIYSFDAQTGALEWSAQTGGIDESSPALAGGQ